MPCTGVPGVAGCGELGAAVAYLCSAEAAFMIGHALVLDGGIVAA